jgi:hypothetical protein
VCECVFKCCCAIIFFIFIHSLFTTHQGGIVTFEPTADVGDAIISCNATSGTFFNVGSYTIVCTVHKGGLNGGACVMNVRVADHTAPVYYSCSADVHVESDSEQTAVNWHLPVVYDAVDGSDLTYTQSHDPGTDTFSVGTTKVTYTATDAVGNVAKCVFSVVVLQHTSLNCALVGTAADYDANLDIGFRASVAHALGVTPTQVTHAQTPTTDVAGQELLTIVPLTVTLYSSSERNKAEERVNGTQRYSLCACVCVCVCG